VKTLPLSPSVSADGRGVSDRSERAAIMGEICERLVEWSEMRSRREVHSWLCRLATIGGDADSSEALWLYLRISSGDLSQLTASFSELGAVRHRTKQAEQQEMERAVAVIQRHFPELAAALQSLTQHFATPGAVVVKDFKIDKQLAH
jgi:hypothetical protein